ncbi:MAG: beta-ketoacyl-ACP synthase III [Desulfoferrobacter sp.]
MPHGNAYIRSVGRFLPERRLTNKDLEKMVDTSDEWIYARTGIRERRILESGLGNSYMAVRAAQECLERAGVEPADLDAIIVGTVTPDTTFASTAGLVQQALGANRAWGFDLSSACSGFIFSLTVGVQMIESGRSEKVLVIGSDVMSSIIDYQDRNTCVLFGDGAGAVLLERSPEPGYGILDFIQRVDGSGAEFLNVKAGGSRMPASIETVQNRLHFVFQDGRYVYKHAVTEMAAVSLQVLEKNGLSGTDLALFVPHQANLRIIEACANRLGVEMSRVVVNIDRYANTNGATIPLCLYDVCVEQQRVSKGDYVLMSAFGAGFSWGSVLVRWWQ